MTLETLSVLNGQTALAGLVLEQSWTVTIQKKFGCNLWSIFTLVSAMKELFSFQLISNSIFIANLRLKLWFSGFDTIDFTFF